MAKVYTCGMQVEAADTPGQPSNISCFKAKLDKPLTAGSSVVLEWYSVHVGLMVPFPAKASQSDPQRVLLKGSHYASSPYPISTQTTKVSLTAVAHTHCIAQTGAPTCAAARPLYAELSSASLLPLTCLPA